MVTFDTKHLLPMSRELADLCLSSLYNQRSREELIGVGRSIRNAHFQATDKFRSMNLPEIVKRLSRDEQPAVQIPPINELYGNTCGDIRPYWYMGCLAAAKRPNLVFEIGTYLGASALTFALNSSPDCHIITVDLPDGQENRSTTTLSKGDKALVKRASNNVGAAFHGHRLEKCITQLRLNSVTMNILEHLHGRTVDIFFIDGGHSYECVSKDTETALSALSPDGLVLWDDYNWIFPDLRGFLQGVARTRPLVRIAGTQYVVCHPTLA
jgi:hypothetical protein